MVLTCKHPDRDCPGLMCDHPLPCPWHTAEIDLSQTPAKIIIPITAEAVWKGRDKLSAIAEALSPLVGGE